MILYTDAGTSRNGQRGKQRTTLCVASEAGEVLFEKFIGDYTNNEGEILAIVAALKNVFPGSRKEIFSDSRIAVNWVLHGWKQKWRNKHRKKVGDALHNRLSNFIDVARELFINSGCTITWIPRELNKAGWYLEEKYKI